MIEAHAVVQRQAPADTPIVLNVEFEIPVHDVKLSHSRGLLIQIHITQVSVGESDTGVERIQGVGLEVEVAVVEGSIRLELGVVLQIEASL
jgi:hypothetical protein